MKVGLASITSEAAVLNVNLGSTDPTLMPSMDGFHGAATDLPANAEWNDLSTTGISPSPLVFSNLVYSDDTPAVGITISLPGGTNSWTPPGATGLPIFRSHFHPAFDEANGVESEEMLEITGLQDVLTYDLYLYTAGPTVPTVDFIVLGNETTLSSGTVDSFVLNDNYILIQNISPQAGRITVTYQDHDIPDNGVFNGFQLVETPEPDVFALITAAMLMGLQARRR